jgi:hypothetical protein
VSIDFSGKSTSGKSISGTVVIQYSTIKDASVVSYTTGYAPVKFRGSDFSAACSARGSAALTSVKFNLPDASTGRLYYSYASPTSYGGTVSSGTSYGVSSGSSIDNVTFVPKAGYKGTVHLTYTGTDKNGSTFTGHVQIIVTPPSASSHFTDMANTAGAPVDFLYESKVTTALPLLLWPLGNITAGFCPHAVPRLCFADYGSTTSPYVLPQLLCQGHCLCQGDGHRSGKQRQVQPHRRPHPRTYGTPPADQSRTGAPLQTPPTLSGSFLRTQLVSS